MKGMIEKQIVAFSALETEIRKQGLTELEKINIETMVRESLDKMLGRTSTVSPVR